jgi:prophage regulatory protein
MSDRILRPKQAAAILAVSRSTLHRLETGDPSFPAKIRITARAVGWRESDLLSWLESKEVSA